MAAESKSAALVGDREIRGRASSTRDGDFRGGGRKTRLDMRSVFPSAKARDYVVKNYGAVEGMHQTLARLEEYLGKEVSTTAYQAIDD